MDEKHVVSENPDSAEIIVTTDAPAEDETVKEENNG